MPLAGPEVRVGTLEHFSGRESDLTLLSLVRSNEEESIGCLGIENRMCMALSRARLGMSSPCADGEWG